MLLVVVQCLWAVGRWKKIIMVISDPKCENEWWQNTLKTRTQCFYHQGIKVIFASSVLQCLNFKCPLFRLLTLECLTHLHVNESKLLWYSSLEDIGNCTHKVSSQSLCGKYYMVQTIQESCNCQMKCQFYLGCAHNYILLYMSGCLYKHHCMQTHAFSITKTA